MWGVQSSGYCMCVNTHVQVCSTLSTCPLHTSPPVHTPTKPTLPPPPPPQATGKPFTLWLAFARVYETHGDLDNARVILDKATLAPHKYLDDLAAVWAEWAEMELRHSCFKRALDLMRRATLTPERVPSREVWWWWCFGGWGGGWVAHTRIAYTYTPNHTNTPNHPTTKIHTHIYTHIHIHTQKNPHNPTTTGGTGSPPPAAPLPLPSSLESLL